MDLYAVLGVERGATGAEIRRAYQKQARLLHPDLNPGDLLAAERFKAVAGAFEVLRDSRRRAAYDRGELEGESASKAAEVGFEGFDFSSDEAQTGVGFREIFDDVLGGARHPPERGEPAPGEDLEHVAQISFDESLSGAKRRIQLVRLDRCPVCRGSGEMALEPIPCPRCRGSGQIRASRGHMVFSRGCPTCGSRGTISERPCSRCRGEGRLMQSEWLDVQIPPGVTTSSKVRVPECGNAGRFGGRPGDLVLTVEVEPHPFYRREGDELHCAVSVTVFEAALGGHIEVKTPDGPVTIEIPAGTQSGQRFRLRKRGAPRLGGKGRGDLFVEARIWVPAVTEERDRELLRELARRIPHDPRRELEGDGGKE
jgi:molecular chaperone DnaJ